MQGTRNRIHPAVNDAALAPGTTVRRLGSSLIFFPDLCNNCRLPRVVRSRPRTLPARVPTPTPQRVLPVKPFTARAEAPHVFLIPMALDRRSFLKTSLLASVFTAGLPERLLGGVAPLMRHTPEGIVGAYPLSLNAYPVLKNDYGCVRIVIAQLPALPGILVTRLPGAVFTAVSEKCPHQGCSVNLFNSSSQNFLCPCHRATYDSAGKIVSGPTRKSLTPYTATFDGVDTVTIDVPGLTGVSEPLPVNAVLQEIYPNPATTAASVAFTTHQTGRVTVRVVDAAGREVARLVDGLMVAGQHTASLSVASLPAGGYVCELMLEGRTRAVQRINVVH